ncbi:MAG: alpha/beta fold hydrolase [Actinomycetota bacterium]
MMRRTLAVGLATSLSMSGLATLATPAAGVAGFGDVDAGTFYTEAVQWMVDNEITSGVSPECFAPDDPVTRGQAAAFMWRMEGSQAPVGNHGFDDVEADWQQAAVSWMFENGITTGTSDTTYSPDDPLTRGQLAVLLHRLEGSPAAPAPAQFPDVVKSWQIIPVGWMLDEGITTGTSATTFSPDAAVTRGQLAAFFYRYKDSPPVVVDPEGRGCETFDSLAGLNTIGNFSSFTSTGLSRWNSSVPGIQDIRIPSTLDGAQQPSLWLPPSGDGDQPLLVILHSWSANYTQHAGIPYAMWAQENGWAVVAPDFRGRNDNAMSTGSEFAVQDAADAIDYAVAQAGVDGERVYVVGYSGGGMMALLLAGRHPDKVSAVAAWGPPHDLVDFYAFSDALGRPYTGQISAACGGNPVVAGPAQEECLRRSPITYLDTARENEVPVFIAQGLQDPFVHPSTGADVFNPLADPKDRLTQAQIDSFGNRVVPPGLTDWGDTPTYFGAGDPAPVFARESASVLLVYFAAGHDMVYNATARWFASDPD